MSIIKNFKIKCHEPIQLLIPHYFTVPFCAAFLICETSKHIDPVIQCFENHISNLYKFEIDEDSFVRVYADSCITKLEHQI